MQDDFHEALATSGRFTAASDPPLVRIVSPRSRSSPGHSGLQLTQKLGTGRLASRQTVLISRS